MTDYFSTHGCVLSLDGFSCFGSEAPLAAAAFLALRSKKLAMVTIFQGVVVKEDYVG